MASQIYVQFGERHFTASKQTLEKSPYLKKQLAGDWPAHQILFIDQDGDTFAHILRYLRSSVYPLLYTKASGYDYPAYALIHEQAKVLGLPRLAKWTKSQAYHTAIATTYRYAMDDDDLRPRLERTDAQVTAFDFRSLLGSEDSYVCPRGIEFHMGNPDRCGVKCDNSQPDEGPEYIRQLVLKTATTKVETCLQLEDCVDKHLAGTTNS